MDTAGRTRTRRAELLDIVPDIRASKARLLLLQWVGLTHENKSPAVNRDAVLAETWELEQRSVRRARTWLVANGLIGASRLSRGIRYELTPEGAEVLAAVEQSIGASRRGGSLRAAMRSIMRHCAEFKGSVAEVAAVFGVQVTTTLREAVAYAIAYDGIGCSDYADAAYNLGRKARGFRERGEAFGSISAEAWLYRMAKKWRWIPTEGEAELMRERRIKKRRESYKPQPYSTPAPATVQAETVPVKAQISVRRRIADAAAVCGVHNWRILAQMELVSTSEASVRISDASVVGFSADDIEEAKAAFIEEFGRKNPDTDVKFVYAKSDNPRTIEDVAKRL